MDYTQPRKKKKSVDDVCLEPSDKLGFPVTSSSSYKELKLTKWPQNRKDVILLAGRYRFVWLTEEAFIHQLNQGVEQSLEAQGYTSVLTVQWSYDGRVFVHFKVRSKTTQATTECINRIIALPDFSVPLNLSMKWESEQRHMFPLTARNLRSFFPPSTETNTSCCRNLVFHNMSFTPYLCRLWASSCNFAYLRLESCKFLDGGVAFLEECVLLREHPKQLHMAKSLPFELETWKLFLSQISGQWTLLLRNIDLSSDNMPTPAPEIRSLEIHHCQLSDDMDPLIESVEANHGGPQEIGLVDVDLSEEGKARFFRALASNTHVDHLSLEYGFATTEAESLANVLRTNHTLKRLSVVGCELTRESWEKLLSALSANVSLLRFHVLSHFFVGEERQRQVLDVKNMLATNKHIEEIDILQIGHLGIWRQEVTPLLEANHYRKKFARIHREPSDSLRAGLLGRALEIVAVNPSLFWLALQLNPGTVVSRIQERQV